MTSPYPDTGTIDAIRAEAAAATALLEAERRDGQIAQRDLAPYRDGNIGIPYAFSFDGPEPGPHVLVTCLAHGNEPGGLEAVIGLIERGFRPARGRLSLAICNVAAYHAGNGVDPYGRRFVDEDFNRIWSDDKLFGPGTSVELARGRELQPLVASADVLLDLHATPYEATPYFVLKPDSPACDLAARVGVPHTRFMFSQGSAHSPTLANYRQFSDPNSGCLALSLECGLFFAREGIAVATTAIAELLKLHDMIAPADYAALATWRDQRPRRDVLVLNPEPTQTAKMSFRSRPGDFRVYGAGEIVAFDGDRPIVAPFDGALVLWLKQTFEVGVQAFMWARFDTSGTAP